MYYRARWYDPQTGRFISEDPIEFQGGTNWYAYVGNNPLSNWDPSGLEAFGEMQMYLDPPSPLQYDYREIKPASPFLTKSSKFPSMTPAQLNKRDYQCRSIKELVRREALYGTVRASADSSVTDLGWSGRAPLDGLNNHSTGNIPYYGRDIDVDFMMDTYKYSFGLSGTVPGVATVVYAAGVVANTVRKGANGENWDSWYPNHDPGEQLGIGFIERRYKFGDIFDENWFKEHCPCEN
jgi:uncharacterized protein RhaS with RHS repeats